jgi:hypothetical protein
LESAFQTNIRYDGADMSTRGYRSSRGIGRSGLRQGRYLVNNAGIQFVAPIESFPAAKWDAILAIPDRPAVPAERLDRILAEPMIGGRIIAALEPVGTMIGEHRNDRDSAFPALAPKRAECRS